MNWPISGCIGCRFIALSASCRYTDSVQLYCVLCIICQLLCTHMSDIVIMRWSPVPMQSITSLKWLVKCWVGRKALLSLSEESAGLWQQHESSTVAVSYHVQWCCWYLYAPKRLISSWPLACPSNTELYYPLLACVVACVCIQRDGDAVLSARPLICVGSLAW